MVSFHHWNNCDCCFSLSFLFSYIHFLYSCLPLASVSPHNDANNTTFEKRRDSTMSMSNSMAFISQFGEYNPGGGKDEVLKYLNESKKQVILAEKALKTILDTVNSASSS